MSKKPKRERTIRRETERDVRKEISARVELAKLEPGGSPERPLEVVSASLVEPTALALGCALCGAALRLVSHDANATAAGPLRVVAARCAQCGHLREVYVRVGKVLH